VSRISIREARAIGKDAGKASASWVDYPDFTFEEWEAGVMHKFGCYDDHEHPVDWIVCEAIESEANARQYADSPTYDFARQSNSDDLFDAYDDGIYKGALAEAKKRFAHMGRYSGMRRA